MTRPLCAMGLAALALSAWPVTAPAQQPRAYPVPQNQPQYSTPQSRSPYCAQLEGQLAALDRGTADANPTDQAKRYEDAVRKLQGDLDRLTAQARRAGCEGGGFFSFFGGQPAQCTPLNAQIQQARGNLDRAMNDYQRAQSNVGADHETQRRSIIGALAQNDCGPQYARLANQGGGGFFDRLFGPGTIISPDDSSSSSNTYKTLCVRTCDGFYFPISYSTVPNRFADDEKTCQKLCPAADVALYSHRSSGEDIGQAVSTSGKLYTELPNAFAYRKQFNPSCSCKAVGQTWADALKQLDDQTIERGDVVVTTEERAKQMSQPQTDAQGRPLKPAPKGTPPAQPAAAAPDQSDDPSKRKVRTVGPTFLPAH